MKKLDIETFSRKMPYKICDADYFDNLPFDTLSKLNKSSPQIEIEAYKRTQFTRSIIWLSAISTAAMIAIGIFITSENNDSTELRSEEQIAEYFATLSDSDLEYLIDESEVSYEFYANL